METARALGIPNATHNNTRGHLTRLLEERLSHAAGGGYRVLNLETGSLAMEAAMKLVLARFYRVQEEAPAPRYAGRTPVFFVIGNDDGGLHGNYHGTTVLTQTLRGMWPELTHSFEQSGLYLVRTVRPNSREDLERAFVEFERPPYKLAGFFHEIVMMNYGARLLSKEFLRRAYELSAQHDVPTVADEIQSCLWAPNLFLFRDFGLRPSCVAVGKGFPGGEYPASRLLFDSELDTLPLFGALVTNGQEEIASLAYLVTMTWAEANRDVTRAIGERYEAGLKELAVGYPEVIADIPGQRHLCGLAFRDLPVARAFVADPQCGGPGYQRADLQGRLSARSAHQAAADRRRYGGGFRSDADEVRVGSAAHAGPEREESMMKIGIPKETKSRECRVSCTPGGARALVQRGHTVLVERKAGLGSGYADAAYADAGATLVPTAADAWAAPLVMKVKEPLPDEYQYLRPDLTLFTYLHLAADRTLTEALLSSRVTGLAYETIVQQRRLPLLEPMSEIAGRMSALVGSYFLGTPGGGEGVLLSGVPGVLPGRVLVLGGGTAGMSAALIAAGLGADVVILDVNLERLRWLETVMPARVRTLYSTEQHFREQVPLADLIIGAVLLPGAKAPRLITREMLDLARPGAVIVDIAIDQGGCAETSQPTTHDHPTYTVAGVVHYCVTNMPGAYARTSTQALTNATAPYAIMLAEGMEAALREHVDLRAGLNTWHGEIVHPSVAAAFDLPCAPNPYAGVAQ